MPFLSPLSVVFLRVAYIIKHVASIYYTDSDFKEYKARLEDSGGRVLGVDYGESGIGVAISDAGRILASPHALVKNKSYKELMPEISRIVEGGGGRLVVVGLPLEMNGKEGETAAKVREFAAALAPHLPGVEIVFMDERLTSAQAEKSLVRDFDMSRAKRKRLLDKLSAARILQSFLDRMNRG
jgi:putative Holliday junction resolvase